MSGISFQSPFSGGIDLMACDGNCGEGSWPPQNSTPPISQRVFPGISLHDIVEAYTQAEGDANYAAELLAVRSLSSRFPDKEHRYNASFIQEIEIRRGLFSIPYGLELGIDVVRDVLEHFSGDTNKATITSIHQSDRPIKEF
ncbi:hypothetical protein R1sor_010201 [Riccia sorocarpa]|uniref:At5g58720/SDE5-like UBA-like domain-containing protein n=1 Tax=Riccia sorocarpa TaxID=122646 RepID=A0ABD3I1A0_9MARC